MLEIKIKELINQKWLRNGGGAQGKIEQKTKTKKKKKKNRPRKQNKDQWLADNSYKIRVPSVHCTHTIRLFYPSLIYVLLL